MRRPRLSKKDFLSWLYKHHPDDAVGIAGDEDVCPLACYFRDQRGYSAPKVYGEVWESGGVFGNKWPLPAWAQRFIAMIDKRPHKAVTAREAIAWIEGIALEEKARAA